MSTEADTLVSVMMIFFNAEEFFEAAIASVLAQRVGTFSLLIRASRPKTRVKIATETIGWMST